LRGCGLTSLPEALADLPALRDLDLAGNAIRVRRTARRGSRAARARRGGRPRAARLAI